MTRTLPLIEPIGRGGVRIRFAAAGALLTRREVQRRWQADERFCTVFSERLAEQPFEGFFWETPPLTGHTADLPFECAVIAAPGLARTASPASFAPQFAVAAPGEVISFANLSGDAELVVPREIDSGVDYAHLAAFLRTAPREQIRAAWRRVGEVSDHWLATGRTCWTSTAGFGVPWLHLRIDARPKYYSHAPYRALDWGMGQ